MSQSITSSITAPIYTLIAISPNTIASNIIPPFVNLSIQATLLH